MSDNMKAILGLIASILLLWLMLLPEHYNTKRRTELRYSGWVKETGNPHGITFIEWKAMGKNYEPGNSGQTQTKSGQAAK